MGARERYGMLKKLETLVERSVWVRDGGKTGVPSMGFAVRGGMVRWVSVRWGVTSMGESLRRIILVFGEMFLKCCSQEKIDISSFW